MKQSNDNRIVTATFICEDDAEAEQVINEISALATDRGCNLLFSDVGRPEDHHMQAAEELGIYDHSRS